jgi:hypothetical protein
MSVGMVPYQAEWYIASFSSRLVNLFSCIKLTCFIVEYRYRMSNVENVPYDFGILIGTYSVKSYLILLFGLLVSGSA